MSPLGQLLDHNLDQFSHVFFCIQGLAMVKSGAHFWIIFMVIHGQLFPHFTIEFRKHFTGFHYTVVEINGMWRMGATELCIIMYSLEVWYAIVGNEHCDNEYNPKDWGLPIDLPFRESDFVALLTFIMSIQYNISNFVSGI